MYWFCNDFCCFCCSFYSSFIYSPNILRFHHGHYIQWIFHYKFYCTFQYFVRGIQYSLSPSFSSFCFFISCTHFIRILVCHFYCLIDKSRPVSYTHSWIAVEAIFPIPPPIFKRFHGIFATIFPALSKNPSSAFCLSVRKFPASFKNPKVL